MPDKKTTEFSAAGALTAADILGLVQGGGNVRTTLAALATYLLTETAIVPANLPYRGARVRLSANFNPPTTGFNLVSWGIEDRDTGSMWSAGQPTRMIVPAGVTKVSLATYIRSPAGATSRSVFILKNGDYFQGGPGMGFSATSFDLNIASSVIDVVADDYFEVQVHGSTAAIGAGLSGVIGLGSWFELRVVEYT